MFLQRFIAGLVMLLSLLWVSDVALRARRHRACVVKYYEG